MLVKLQPFCGYVNLKKGCIFIGCVSLLANTILAVLALVTLIVSGYIVTSNDHLPVEWGVVATGTAIVLALHVISLGFNISLIFGIVKNKSGFVKAYLIFTVSFLIINVILVIIILAYGGALIHAFREIIFVAINIYYLLVINNYCMKMTGYGNNEESSINYIAGAL